MNTEALYPIAILPGIVDVLASATRQLQTLVTLVPANRMHGAESRLSGVSNECTGGEGGFGHRW